MSEHGIAASQGRPPLSERLVGILPIDKSPRALVGEVPSGASALLAFALARRHGAALVVLPTPHHLDAFLADAATISAVEAESEVRSPKSEVNSSKSREIPNSRNPETPPSTGFSDFRGFGISPEVAVLPFRLLEAASEDDEDAAVLGARLDAARALATRHPEIPKTRNPENPNPGETPKTRKPEIPPPTSDFGLRTSDLRTCEPANLQTCEPLLVATSVQALMQAAPDVRAAEAETLRVAVGAPCDIDALAAALLAGGHERVPDVVARRQIAVRGGILDVWPVNAPRPVRIESDGELCESIRPFDPGTQASVAHVQSVEIPPATGHRARAPLTELLPSGACILWLDHAAIEAHAEMFLEGRKVAAPLQLPAIRRALAKRDDIAQWAAGPPGEGLAHARWKRLFLPLAPIAGAIPPETRDPDVLAQMRHALVEALADRAREERLDVEAWLDTEGTREHLEAELAGRGFGLRVAPLSSGFEIGPLRLVVVAQSDLYGNSKHGSPGRLAPPSSRGPAPASRIASLEDLSPGDLVVHVEHGIGRFLGMTEIEFDGRRMEVLTLEYADGAKLHVPVTQSHLLARYVGAGQGAPVRLHKLGGRRWAEERGDAEKAVRDLAAAMLETQARREHLPGFAFEPDAPWMNEFEATFPHAETPDQTRCIAEVKRDMASPHPMDRLVCGDAGYGKTEVAMRAAFLAAMQGKQVAVLVPTTVLAQQHFDTFRERMGPYPLRIALHCRFATPAARAAALAGAADGTIDILIGTHGLLQPGVRFKDLGLVIVDEEQRFGVAHKERLKRVRALVDVLTLSATPIPRTLQLGLTGLRDLSLLQTPPRERVLTETRVVRNTDEVVREAVQRELDRGGQVFYLHNRIASIEIVRERLRHLVPRARVAVAHGQMSAAEVADVMRGFVEGETDVLLSTTIIENGVDIPRANTILIDRADRFGIADLYQLRGRVGRGSRRGYAYLLTPGTALDSDARERLKALREHQGGGAGFKLAMRDLGIRGAGNLLGAAQSGHIAAVGFTLYCQLLRRSVAQLKGEPPPLVVDAEVTLDALDTSPGASDPARAACIPYAYVEEDAHRIAAFRRLAECSSADEVEALRRDLADRYGPPPPPVTRLLRVTLLRIRLSALRIPRLEVAGDELRVYLRDGTMLRERGGDLPRIPADDPDAQLAQIEKMLRRR